MVSLVEKNTGLRIGSSFDGRYLLVRLFIVMVILASLSNGATFWLKRVGWLAPEMSQTFLAEHLYPRDHVLNEDELAGIQAFRNDMYRAQGFELALKLLKDVTIIFFGVVFFCLVIRQASLFRLIRDQWLLIFLCLLLLLSACQAWLSWGPFVPIAGLRGFLFIPLVILATRCISLADRAFLAKALALLIMLQFLVMPVELLFSIPFFSAGFFGDRLVGFFLMPISLGVTAVLTLLFYARYAQDKKNIDLLVIVTGLLCFLTRSGTAILLFLLAAYMLKKRAMGKPRINGLHLIVGVALVSVCLPVITERMDIYDSLWGRLHPLLLYVENASLSETIFGRGLGIGTNALGNLLMSGQVDTGLTPFQGLFVMTDSLPTSLFVQFGLFGLLLFYGLILYAAVKSPMSRPFFCIFSLASLTVNITELFPVNIVFGLVLTYALHGYELMVQKPANGSVTAAIPSSLFGRNIG